jgi:hypothetical protein
VWVHGVQDVTVDLVVVDEAAQALELATWGALLRGRRAVLAGDHLQLPPTVLSTEAEHQVRLPVLCAAPPSVPALAGLAALGAHVLRTVCACSGGAGRT